MKRGDHKNATARDLRRFGLVTGAIFVGVFGILLPLWRHRPIPLWPHLAGVPLVVLGALAPALLRPVYRGWMLGGGALGWVNTRIILGVVFFAVLTPLALVRRALGRDALGRRPDRRLTTYRLVTPALARDRMKEPF